MPPASSWGWFCPFWQEHPHHSLVLLKLECVSESSGRFDETQMAGPHPRASDSGLGWGCECPSLTSSPVRLILLAQGQALRTSARASVRPARGSEVPWNQQGREAQTGEPWTAAKATRPLTGRSPERQRRSRLLIPRIQQPSPVRRRQRGRGKARVGCRRASQLCTVLPHLET